MTSPNKWWKEEPYATTIKDPYCLVDHTIYNIEAIIEEIKRRERGETTARFDIASEAISNVYTCESCLAKQIRKKHLFCPHCGLKINWK